MVIVFAIIGALAIATVVFLIAGGGSSNQPNQPVGTEVTTATGLKYIDESIGTGASPQPGKTVTVHYTGKLQDGTTFDSSVDKGQPMTYVVGGTPMIRGWDEGVMTMKAGGKRRLIIPPQLGYGPQGRPPRIPPNATLYFEMELLDVK